MSKRIGRLTGSRFKKDVLSTFFGQSAVLIVAFGINKLVSINLSPEEFALFSIANKSAAVIAFVMLLALGISLPRFLARVHGSGRERRSSEKSLLLAALSMCGMAILVVSLLLYLGKGQVSTLLFADRMHENLVLPTILFAIGTTVSALLYAYLRGVDRFKDFNRIQIIFQVLSLGFVALAGASIAHQLSWRGLFLLLASVGILIIIWQKSYRSVAIGKNAFSKNLKTLSRYGIPRVPGEFFLFSITAIPLVIINWRFSDTTAGVFSVAVVLVTMVMPLFQFTGMVLLTLVSKAASTANIKAVHSKINKLRIIYFFVAIAITLVLWFFTKPVVTIIFSAEHVAMLGVVRIVALSIIPYAFYLLLRNPIDAAATKPYNTFNLGIALAVLVVGLCLAPGPFEAAIVFPVAFTVLALLSELSWYRINEGERKKRTPLFVLMLLFFTVTLTAVALVSVDRRSYSEKLTCSTIQNARIATSSRVTPVSQSSVISEAWSSTNVSNDFIVNGTKQYVGYYNADARMTIAYRDTSEDLLWTTYSIPGNDAVVDWDSHRSIELGLDSSGALHVAGNMHGTALNYWVQTDPQDLGSLKRVRTMAEPGIEQKVTYPLFVRLYDGSLIFSFRDGSSGDGSMYFYRYDLDDARWRMLGNGPVFDGGAGQDARSAYVTIADMPSPEGYFHVTWMWRDTVDAATNSGLSYARTKNFKDWELISGEPLSLPIRPDTPGVRIDKVGHYGGLLNGRERTISLQGSQSVAVVYGRYDNNGGNQLYLAAYDTSADSWSTRAITNWAGRWTIAGAGTLDEQYTLDKVIQVERNGDILVDYSCDGKEYTARIDSASYRVKDEYGRLAEKGQGGLEANIVQAKSYDGRANTSMFITWLSRPANHDKSFDSYSKPSRLVYKERRPVGGIDK